MFEATPSSLDSSQTPLPRREKILPTPFFLEASRQLRLFWAGLLVQGLERASQAFYKGGFLRVIKRECPTGQKSPALIMDPGLFCAFSDLMKNSLRFFSFEYYLGMVAFC